MSLIAEWSKLRLLIVGGKGGVGKTTMSTAAAISMAASYPDKKVLLISTDPAHSLSDILEVDIGDMETPVTLSGNCPNLFAREIDSPRLADLYKEKNETYIKMLADRGTYFDREDIENFFKLSLPGIDEVMAVIEVAGILRKNKYDLIVLDTAPTGHTIKLMFMPEQMEKWLSLLDKMQAKHRYMVSKLTRRKYVKDKVDLFLKEQFDDVKRVKQLLTDNLRSEFVPVSIPEPIVIEETRRLVDTLREMRIPMKKVFINRVIVDNDCPVCTKRKLEQEKYLKEIMLHFGDLEIVKFPNLAVKDNGFDNLKQICVKMTNNGFVPGIHTKQNAGKNIIDMEAVQNRRMHNKLSLSENKKFIVLGGKGGVGKTSVAAATAMHLAMKYPSRKIFVLSIDPAHSLSDCFSKKIGDEITPIDYSEYIGNKAPITEGKDKGPEAADDNQPPISTNLFGMEINAARLFEELKAEYREAIEEIFERFLANGLDIQFDREIITELFSLAPPGLDEIMALKNIIDLDEEGKFDNYILDTSPTGHLLRFLEMPEMAREWLHSLFRLLIKYKGIVRLSNVAQELLDMARAIKFINGVFGDPERCELIAVSIAEDMSVKELGRLLSKLEDRNISCRQVVMNRMLKDSSDCEICSEGFLNQVRHVESLRREFPEKIVKEIEQFSDDADGIKDLARLSNELYG